MAYDRAWDETLPIGASTDAEDIDLVIRNLKADLRARLADAGIDLTDDPVVFVPPLGTPGLNVQDHWSDGFLLVDVDTYVEYDTIEYTYVGVMLGGAASHQIKWGMPLRLPAGAEFNALSVLVYRETGATVAVKLYDIVNGVRTLIDSATSASTGWHGLALAGIGAGVTIAAGHTYLAVLELATKSDGTANARFQSLLVENS